MTSSQLSLWWAGARARTLPAAVVPVLVGTAAAADQTMGWGRGIIWWRAIAALGVSLALQLAVNYANDYSDGVRGTDDARVGPVRLVGSGLVEPKRVKQMAFAWFGIAALIGLSLVFAVGPELLLVGVASILAGWFYTGGSNPYGYMGLGEVFVFVFFGLVATAGTTYVLREQVTGLSLAAAVAVGFLATALLVTNNLRDIPTDTESGKNTLAVRIGDAATRQLYVVLVLGAIGIGAALAFDRPWALLSLLALPAAAGPIRGVLSGATGPGLIPVLVATGRTQLLFGIALTLGLWI